MKHPTLTEENFRQEIVVLTGTDSSIADGAVTGFFHARHPCRDELVASAENPFDPEQQPYYDQFALGLKLGWILRLAVRITNQEAS